MSKIFTDQVPRYRSPVRIHKNVQKEHYEQDPVETIEREIRSIVILDIGKIIDKP